MSECHTNSLKVPQNIDFEGVVSLSYSVVKEPMLIAIGYTALEQEVKEIFCAVDRGSEFEAQVRESRLSRV
jgi:hypothetical protein